MRSKNFKFIKPGEVRTRFAPSPTGFLHIGGARTALFNYLFAKKHQGAFILRIEDTDRERSKPEFEKDILDSLKWLGIDWSEGPYHASSRRDVYAKYLERLLAEKKAYRCFCSEEELEAQRQYSLSQGQPWRYNGKCAKLAPREIEKKLSEDLPSIIRFRTTAKKVEFDDVVRGRVGFESSLIGDFSIARDIREPLYNLAVVVDDFEMRISHVIRAEEHIANTPKQILIQEALNFPRPKYAHLPLILGSDRSKLSKRHGAEAVSDFRKQGYLPEALVNFMAFLGWNPGGEREIYSLPSLVKEFGLERVQKGGAVFNVSRLDFINGFYIRKKSVDKLTKLCLPYFGAKNVSFDYLKKIVAIYQERLKKLSELKELTDFFFQDKLNYDKKLLRWKQMGDREVEQVFDELEKVLSKVKAKDWNKDSLTKVLFKEAEKIGDKGRILWPLRVALTGKEASAPPFDVAEILGKEKTFGRLKDAKKAIAAKNNV
ncbi:MAG: nondiscriminating glutamyl-tRNA synthetase [Parcubacteria group bacterium Gr01-1014_30]|nr:MAG: nondiscriminating glutamyl-tRNA synthetase [Parcubacteria group bacterium Gr01-1014_30]